MTDKGENRNPESGMEEKKQNYEQYVKEMTPTHNLWLQMLKAFIIGGIICVLGQGILQFCTDVMSMDKETAASWCSLSLIFLSVLLTGLNIYPWLFLAPTTISARTQKSGGQIFRRIISKVSVSAVAP